MNKTVDKLRRIEQEMNNYFLERAEEIHIGINAIISRKHVYFLGVAGTAKSMICRAMAQHVGRMKYFEFLLTKFTVVEEIFGSVKFSELENDKYERNIENKLADVHISFLDEIFKANSSILNALLKVMNERKFDNGGITIDVPLLSLFTASNELPDADEGLQAMYDRLHFRKLVRPISDFDNERKLLQLNEDYQPITILTLDELQELHQLVDAVDASSVIDDMVKIYRTLQQDNIFISDRKKKECVRIIQAEAVLNGRNEAQTDDLSILQHVLWNEPTEIQTVQNTVLHISNPFEERAKTFMTMLDELEKKVDKFTKMDADAWEIYNKGTEMQKDLKKYIKTAKSQNKPYRTLQEAHDRVQAMLQRIQTEFLKIGKED